MKQDIFKIRSSSPTLRRRLAPWCILAVPMACTIWLKYYPIFNAFYISLFKYDPNNTASGTYRYNFPDLQISQVD